MPIEINSHCDLSERLWVLDHPEEWRIYVQDMFTDFLDDFFKQLCRDQYNCVVKNGIANLMEERAL